MGRCCCSVVLCGNKDRSSLDNTFLSLFWEWAGQDRPMYDINAWETGPAVMT